MSDETPEQIAGNWDLVARRYAEYIDPMTALYAADTVERAEVGSGDRVLDVASGFGAATLLAARRADEVVAVDFSSEMCDALRERAASEGAANVTVRQMDAQALDLPDDGFDAGVSSFGAMICPDRVKAFAEMARATRPGGRLATVCWQGPPNNEWLQTFMSTVTTALPDADPPTPPPFMELADPDRLRSEVEAAGWSDVEIVGVTHEAAWADDDAAWAAIAESNPLFGPLLEQLPAEVVTKLRTTFRDLIDQRGDAHLSAGAWIAVGRA
ncbi:MAG: methyltransferase domain-containing protein [Acidimicrobiales bacterium]|nr:methyltransferase domain-containing protein [Acidimicrobiales bacterium]